MQHLHRRVSGHRTLRKRSPTSAVTSKRSVLIPSQRIAAQVMILQSRGMRLILKVLVNTSIFNRFLCRLNGLAISFSLFRNDLRHVVADRMEFWVIDPLIADGFWLSARQLGQLLMSAAHGINFAAHAAPAVPIQLPLAALRDVSLPIPTILLALGYPSNPLRRRRYVSPEAAIADWLLFVEWYEHNLCWLAECLRRSISNGKHTVWDFATALGVSSKDVFLAEVADSRREADLDELDILFSTVEETPSTFTDNELNLGGYSNLLRTRPDCLMSSPDIAQLI
ncbi:hypothetical protein C8R43DRAFT_1133187 [Mycena crocata]|nr:hypothetical protein C8R43DRAFT_1133187 [Mycena crocata]